MKETYHKSRWDPLNEEGSEIIITKENSVEPHKAPVDQVRKRAGESELTSATKVAGRSGIGMFDSME